MKRLSKYIIIVCLLFACISCNQEEVATFDSVRGVNFVLYNANYNEYTDDYEKLKSEYNFYDDYARQGTLTLNPCTLHVGLQLEGTFSESPIRVKIKAEPVEGFDMPEITLPEEVVIEAGEYQANFSVLCQQPKYYEKEYRVKLSIDYANSDVIAGTKERQSYEITISDKINWKDMYVENEEQWNADFAEYLGNYGGTKARFVIVSLVDLYQASYSDLCSMYYYTQIGGYYEWYGFYYYGYDVYYYLEEYNSNQDTPLCEPDGTPVEIPNIY